MTAQLPLAPLALSGGTLALIVVLAVVAGVALGLGIARLRHVTARNRIMARFDQFKERVISLREQVEAIKKRHQELTVLHKDYKEPMVGTTLGVYTKLAEDFRRLGDDWLRRMDLWEKVQQLVRTEKPLGAGRFHEAGKLLDTLGSFDEVDDACQTCTKQLDRLEKGHDQGRKELARAEERVPALRKEIEAVGALKLPTDPYEKALQACPPLIEQARQALAADPLGAGDTLDNCHKKMDDLGEWVQDVALIFHRSGEARAEIDRVKRDVASRRSGGLLLTEPEGNPDPLLSRGDDAHAQCLEALQRAENKPAKKQLDAAFKLAKEADDVIERQAAARARCAKEVPARRTEAQRVRQAVSEAEGHRNELDRDFAAESWRDVASNVAHALELQTASDSQLEEAAAASADSKQHYFRAAGLLDQVQRQQEEAAGLARAVGQSLQKLTALRTECNRQRQEVTDLARKVQGYLGSNQAAVRQGARKRFDDAEGAWRQARGQMDAPRPNWQTAQKELDDAKKAYAAAQKEAEDDVRNYQKLTARLGEVDRDAERVGLLLRQHHEDRSAANEGYRKATEALQRVRQESGDRGADWGQLLAQVEEAAKGLKKAEEQARQDVQLANRAESAIADAGRELDRARGYREDGVTADVGRASGLLEQARRHLGAKEYEKAIDQAGAAQQAAKAAHDAAAGRVRQERQRREEEQRRQSAAAAATAPQGLAGVAPSPWTPGETSEPPPASAPAATGDVASGSPWVPDEAAPPPAASQPSEAGSAWLPEEERPAGS
jgi:hypothetical protein